MHFPLFTYTEGLGFGSFQQLLRDANAGFLCSSYTNTGFEHLGSDPTVHNGLESQLTCVNSEEYCEHEDICKDGYSAGTDSDHDTPVRCQSSDIPSSEIDDYVVSFSDPISVEEFMRGRDFEYGDFAFGVDDTDLDNVELDSDCDPSIDNIDLSTVDLQKNIPLFGADHIGSTEKVPDHLTAPVVDLAEETVCVVADCACPNHAIAHEISSRYEDGVKTGFFKR